MYENDHVSKFIEYLKKFLMEKCQDVQIHEKYIDASRWTLEMLGRGELDREFIESSNDTPIITKIANSLYKDSRHDNVVLEQYKEYFRIDYTVWENYRNMLSYDFGKCESHCSRSLLAFEHENDFNKWTDEFVELFYIDADLRVVMSYCDNLANNQENIEMVLNICNEITQRMAKRIDGDYLLNLAPRKKDFADSNGEICNRISISNIINKMCYFRYQNGRWIQI